MKCTHYCFLILTLICQSISAQEISSAPEILAYVENNLPLYGTLKKSGDFIYLDLDDDYVNKLINFIQKDGFEEPPYFGGSDLVGAHITVIYPVEVKKYGVQEIRECGQAIHFTPRTCQIVCPLKWEGINEIYLIIVDAPELDDVRKKYGLPEQEYDFHITIGVTPTKDKAA